MYISISAKDDKNPQITAFDDNLIPKWTRHVIDQMEKQLYEGEISWSRDHDCENWLLLFFHQIMEAIVYPTKHIALLKISSSFWWCILMYLNNIRVYIDMDVFVTTDTFSLQVIQLAGPFPHNQQQINHLSVP